MTSDLWACRRAPGLQQRAEAGGRRRLSPGAGLGAHEGLRNEHSLSDADNADAEVGVLGIEHVMTMMLAIHEGSMCGVD